MRDGIRQNSASQSSRPVDAFLLDRIEILKGPASLLYGEGALAGAVNLVSKSPIAQPNLAALVAYGGYGQYRTGVGINVPLRRNLFARVDVAQSGSDGYVGHSPQKLVASAASLRWLPTSNISLKATGTYTDQGEPYFIAYVPPYADSQQTWLYLDPQRGVIASRMERASRWNRWLYHGFHSLDFPFMYYKRPLWDIVVILLSIGGIAMSVTSTLPAWRRLARHGRAIGGRMSSWDQIRPGETSLRPTPQPSSPTGQLSKRAKTV